MKDLSQQFHTESQQAMNFSGFIIWTNFMFCLPLTLLVICWLCCLVKKEHVIYFTNLLIANLVHISIMFSWQLKQGPVIERQDDSICIAGLMASWYFKTYIAIERCFVITCPKLKCSKQPKGSMLVSLLIWIFCIATVVPIVVFEKFFILYIFALLPALLFILFLVWTFHALAADTLVPTEEKQRIVRIFLLFFFNYFLMILPGVICSIGVFLAQPCFQVIIDKLLTLLLLGPFLDLILVCFMHIRCRFDSTAPDVAEHRPPGWVMSQILRDRENRV